MFTISLVISQKADAKFPISGEQDNSNCGNELTWSPNNSLIAKFFNGNKSKYGIKTCMWEDTEGNVWVEVTVRHDPKTPPKTPVYNPLLSRAIKAHPACWIGIGGNYWMGSDYFWLTDTSFNCSTSGFVLHEFHKENMKIKKGDTISVVGHMTGEWFFNTSNVKTLSGEAASIITY